MRQPDKVDIQLDLKFLKLSGTWEPNDAERSAAWQLYVELVTRVAAVTLLWGSLREALTSIHAVFPATRAILREHGPALAAPKPTGHYSFGYLAVSMLNFTIRPRLAYWHPTLSAHEEVRQPGVPAIAHEDAWDQNGNLRADLNQMGEELRYFCEILARACDVPSLSAAIPKLY